MFKGVTRGLDWQNISLSDIHPDKSKLPWNWKCSIVCTTLWYGAWCLADLIQGTDILYDLGWLCHLPTWVRSLSFSQPCWPLMQRQQPPPHPFPWTMLCGTVLRKHDHECVCQDLFSARFSARAQQLSAEFVWFTKQDYLDWLSTVAVCRADVKKPAWSGKQTHAILYYTGSCFPGLVAHWEV